MSDHAGAPASAPLFQEIKTGPPERTYPYKRLSFLTYLVTTFATLNCLSMVVQLFALFGQGSLLARIAQHAFASHDAMVDAALASDRFVGIVAALSVLTLLATYISSGFWIYRAAANVRALGARGLETSPGWSVGWYAVPFMALFRPYQAMVQIYQASVSPMRWRLERAPPLLPIWWAAWIVCGLAGYAVSVMARLDRSLPSLRFWTNFQLVDICIDIAAAVLFLLVVWSVFRAQKASRVSMIDVATVFA